jgi:hypothetical protein
MLVSRGSLVQRPFFLRICLIRSRDTPTSLAISAAFLLGFFSLISTTVSATPNRGDAHISKSPVYFSRNILMFYIPVYALTKIPIAIMKQTPKAKQLMYDLEGFRNMGGRLMQAIPIVAALISIFTI